MRTSLVFVRRCVLVSQMAAAVVVMATIGCESRAKQLPEFGKVPLFTMVDSQGRNFNSRQMNARVWIVDFIYTHCPGPCPMMSSKIRTIETRTAGQRDVRFLSITVDPQRDSPTVLDQFAHRFGGPNDRWLFLTGTSATVHLLAHDVFKVGDVITQMDHSTKFILVDKNRIIRGYYSSFDPDSVSEMVADAQALQRVS